MTARTEPLETLAALLARHRPDMGDIDLATAHTPRASLAEALRGGADPLRLDSYFASLGRQLRALDDLLAINSDDTEEELQAVRVQKGVAVGVASDALWVLYTP